ncbi:TetR/AcrR family transcriptional regulator C-terminal domain-containing protein [Allokutzneria sp. A3M-2-11 16]|uniref:TetR/AcrR family transcriptional regulator C-terminal domain-containing protein n=1 Tax=Allokutzneria sp. A3M-2-11 16 TaxID=2962043 RepID=UPI0020B8D881|nr:TetR/AcrR family transcriptional regulator C-terminal domain-containing protein [Allokutzneria sp. A3M-2-11 16]MCP3805089.1 TetR/AcrR family transcriptional regulator C-terminal domain-containing protein [Allokutzneria sp. A3M-2-11 16]
MKLTREKVLAAALVLVEENGVQGLSMRKLAAAVGVEAMSLYNHVPNKDAVIDGIAELVIRRMALPEPTGDWKADLRQLANAFRAAATRYPHAAGLVLTRQLGSNASLAGTNAALSALRGAGFDAEEAVHALRAVLAFLVGTVLREVESGPAFDGADPVGVAQREAELLASPFPAVAESAPFLASCEHDREYEFGLDLLLAALEFRRTGSGPGRSS